jgi:4'-phosphopantetheinyl transferase
MVALAGCIAISTINTENPSTPLPFSPTNATRQVGIDITCTTERERRNAKTVPQTEEELHSFIDIFSDVFSNRELQDMKRAGPAASAQQSIRDRLRRFYTYWALKEAYIKLTGEALLAPWLRQLEFLDVVAPNPPPSTETDGTEFGIPYTGTRILLDGQEIHDVRIEIVAVGGDYIFATAARGPGIGEKPSITQKEDSWAPFRALDIQGDIRPCTTGQCQCLDSAS